MSKKVFATIFAAILAVSAFSGCGDNGGSSTPSGSTPSSSSGSSTPVSGSDEPYTPTYPIVSEPVTFTAASSFDNMPNTLWYNAYAEATNVNIEWTYWSDWETQMGIALAGDSLPDFVFNLYMSGTDKASIEQYGKAGTLVEYGQYLNIMPNLSAMFEQYPESRVACVNEDGTLYGFPAYLQTPTAYSGTIYYRTDMFKEAGLSEPTTTDELLNAVKTLQEYYSAKDSEFVAFMPYNSGHVTGHLAYWLFPAFGDAVDMDYGTTDGKTVAYNRISDQYRHMMEYLHELYVSGGYYKECFSEDGTNTKPLIIGNHCAITTFGTMYSPDNFASGNYDADIFAPLTSEYTSTQKYPKAYNSRMAASFVSSKCKDVETIMKWIDAFYTTTENPIADGVFGISMWLGTRGVNIDIVVAGTVHFYKIQFHCITYSNLAMMSFATSTIFIPLFILSFCKNLCACISVIELMFINMAFAFEMYSLSLRFLSVKELSVVTRISTVLKKSSLSSGRGRQMRLPM